MDSASSIKEQQRVLRALTEWRDAEARTRGVPQYLILPNTTINSIAQALPTTKEELLLIKGIKEAKWRSYGEVILGITNNTVTITPVDEIDFVLPDLEPQAPKESMSHDAIPVTRYLNALNQSLKMTGEVRLIGEVLGLKMQGSAIYFSLKDKDDGSTIAVMMWKNQYVLSGIELSDGVEIIATGGSEIYKPTGRLSFKAETIELVGEGAFKKAYEILKKKLTAEGLFAEEKKRQLPEYPTRIGVITSRTGAVIHDFQNNLGRFGFRIFFHDARVEGVAAVADILSALRTMSTQNIEVLVLIRGGGSLESLQAFNNEHVVRAVAEFPVPVICAIGHDQDNSLAELAADFAPSTPTATTALLNSNWLLAQSTIGAFTQNIITRFGDTLWMQSTAITDTEKELLVIFRTIIERYRRYEEVFRNDLLRLQKTFSHIEQRGKAYGEIIHLQYTNMLEKTRTMLKDTERQLAIYNPHRQLARGYSILRTQHGILRSVKELQEGDHFDATLSDGTLSAQVTDLP